MREIMEIFSPSGCEEKMRELLKKRLLGLFDEIWEDNFGNLIAKSGDGSLCLECGMDRRGVMIVSKTDKQLCFSAVGNVEASNIVGRNVIFENNKTGLICVRDGIDEDEAKFSDLYIETETDLINIGDFGMLSPEFAEEEEEIFGYQIADRISLAAVLEAIERCDYINNVTILFSAQKRLGGRGIYSFFGKNTVEKIITTDGCESDGLVIVAKDERVVSEKNLRVCCEEIAKENEIPYRTSVVDRNFHMDRVIMSCQSPCVAIGIGVLNQEDRMQSVRKCDFDSAVVLLEKILKKSWA